MVGVRNEVGNQSRGAGVLAMAEARRGSCNSYAEVGDPGSNAHELAVEHRICGSSDGDFRAFFHVRDVQRGADVLFPFQPGAAESDKEILLHIVLGGRLVCDNSGPLRHKPLRRPRYAERFLCSLLSADSARVWAVSDCARKPADESADLRAVHSVGEATGTIGESAWAWHGVKVCADLDGDFDVQVEFPKTIVRRPRKLKARWTLELQKDLEAMSIPDENGFQSMMADIQPRSHKIKHRRGYL